MSTSEENKEYFCNSAAAEMKKWRERRKLFQKDLADKVAGRCTRSQICIWESPLYTGHKTSTILRVAEALGCRVRVVFEPIEEK